MKNYAIAIHGGAGTIRKEKMTQEVEMNYRNALSLALKEGNNQLKNGGTALDAVERAVELLENSDLFNAGKGSVFTAEGNHEMEASIMCGQSLNAGAVAGIRSIKNPIKLCRKILLEDDFVYLTGEGAQQFASLHDFKEMDAQYFYAEQRYQQWQNIKDSNKAILDHTDDRKFGTVGAVALDAYGNLAAATSTGGLTNKKFGRVGDSSVIGSGTYANNNTCAISCTGYGEFFLRGVVAYDISCLMEYAGLSLQQACERVVLDKQVKLGGEGGVIGVDAKGNCSLVFNSEGMYRGKASSESDHFEIDIFSNK